MRTPIPLSAALQSTRVDADKQCAINMYPHSDGGYRQFPGLVEFAEYTAPVYNSDYTTVIDTQITTPLSHCYNDDGTKLYVLDSTGTVFQYACSAFGAPTSYSTYSLDMTAEDATPVGIIWGDSDTLYMLGSTTSKIYGYVGSSGGDDLNTFVHASYPMTAFSGLSGTLTDLFTLDGANWLITTTTNCYHYTSSAWVLSTLSQSSSGSPRVRSFDTSGKYFYEAQGGQYRTETAYDLSLLEPVNLSAYSEMAIGLPAGTKANQVYKLYNSNSVFTSTGTLNGAAYFASWAVTDGSTVEAGTLRGSDVMGGVPYFVLDTSVISFDSSGTFLPFGSVNEGVGGTARTVSDTDGTNIVFVTGSSNQEYQFDLTDYITRIIDADLGDATSTAYLDSTFYYAVGGRIYASALADPSDIDPLDFITAESFTDDITRIYALNQLLYAFGSATIEVYFTSGQGNTRLSRQAVLEHGIVGTHAIDSIDDTIYFLDAERRLSRIRGLEYAPITIRGLGKELNSYATVSDCIINAFTYEQENFIEVTFPTQDVSWTVHETSGEVVKREDTSGNRSRSGCYLNVYGKTFSVDHTNGKVYQFSDSTYQDDGSALNRTLYSAKIESETFGFATREFTLDALYVEYDVSASTAITVSVSFDSGATFEMAQTITVTGRDIERLPAFGMATEVIVKIVTSSNTRADILSLAAEAEALDD